MAVKGFRMEKNDGTALLGTEWAVLNFFFLKKTGYLGTPTA